MKLVDEVGTIVFKDYFGNNVRVGDKVLFAGKRAFLIYTNERFIKHLEITKVIKDANGRISVYFQPSNIFYEEAWICDPDDLVMGECLKDIKDDPRFNEWLEHIHTKYKITQ